MILQYWSIVLFMPTPGPLQKNHMRFSRGKNGVEQTKFILLLYIVSYSWNSMGEVHGTLAK